MSDEALPEPDRAEGAPHPRMSPGLIGHEAAVSQALSALASQMHHAWLLTGPEGIGKATFAWAFAGSLLATPPPGGLFDVPPPTHLGLDPEDPLRLRLEALSEPRLALVRRGWDDKAKRLKSQITVDEVRKLHAFLGLSAPDGGRRVVLIDAADEMNVTAANAVLKLLEEPPADTVFLLVSHRPGGLLPTIKSRCRTVRLSPLDGDALASVLRQIGCDTPAEHSQTLTALAAGSPGDAIQLIEADGLKLYQQIIEVLSTCPSVDRPRALALANATVGRGAEGHRDLTLRLIETALSRLALCGSGATMTFANSDEEKLAQRLSPSAAASQLWAAAAQDLPAQARQAFAVNLDPSGVILDMILKVNDLAGRIAQP